MARADGHEHRAINRVTRSSRSLADRSTRRSAYLEARAAQTPKLCNSPTIAPKPAYGTRRNGETTRDTGDAQRGPPGQPTRAVPPET